MKKMITGFVLTGLLSCASVREVVFCQIEIKDTLEDSVAHCAKSGVMLPDKKLTELADWYATDPDGLKKIGDKLDECERRP